MDGFIVITKTGNGIKLSAVEGDLTPLDILKMCQNVQSNYLAFMTQIELQRKAVLDARKTKESEDVGDNDCNGNDSD